MKESSVLLLCAASLLGCTDDDSAGPGGSPEDASAGAQVETLYEGPLPSELVIHSNSVFFNYEGGWSTTGNYTGEVLKLPVGGGDAIRVASYQATPQALAANQDGLFWLTYYQAGGGNDGLVRLPFSGGTPSVVFEKDNITALVIAQGNAFVRSWEGIWRVPLDGAATSQVVASTEVRGMAGDDSSLCWAIAGTDGGTIQMLDLTSDTVSMLATSPSPPGWIATDGASVFWTSLDGTIRAVSKQGGAVVTVAGESGVAARLVADESSLYWISYTNVGADSGVDIGSVLKRTGKQGGNPVKLVQVERFAADLAVDKTHIYWTEWPSSDMPVFDDGWIRRIPK